MLDWAVRPLARKCTITGQAFAVGERVTSALVRFPDGTLDRVDFQSGREEDWCLHGAVLGRWQREIEDLNEDERLARRHRLLSAESLLKALCEEAPTNEESPDADTERERHLLAQFLALHLERKRIIKPLDKSGLRFSFRGDDPTVVTLQPVELSPEDLPRLAEALQPVLEG